MDDLSVQVPLSCPTCGCTQFSESSGANQAPDDDSYFTCAHCGATFSRSQLIDANSESIDATIQDMSDDILTKLSKDLKRAMGRQNWKIK